MLSSKNNCPVPFDQQPLNEYLSLRQSWLFSWSISKKNKFINGLIFILFIILFCVSCCLKILIVPYNIFIILLLDFFISNLILFILFIRLYLGWSYIFKRLLSATVFYEESGWYDGQVWIKTSEYLIQDRLIGLYQVMPFILRIRYIFLIIIVNFLLTYIFYHLF
uniref:Ycf36 n=1 Tax=Thaumatella adunca TaxID=2006976 RepID=A0A1Z1MMY8_9FLOR|nr:hypothetical protein [Thaumatella adunca]ARW67460.1 hypothetical protein [Thaumatella adunca]